MSGKTIKHDGNDWTIRDEGVPVSYVNWITEVSQSNGVIALSFGSSVVDGENRAIHICGRHRLDLTNATHLRDTLTRLIAEASSTPSQPAP